MGLIDFFRNLIAPSASVRPEEDAEVPPPPEAAPSGEDSVPTKETSVDDRRELELADGMSNRFWNISRSGSALSITSGPVGSAGSTEKESHRYEEKARARFDELVAEKLRQGYVDIDISTLSEMCGKAPVVDAVSPVHFSRQGYDNYKHAKTFLGFPVVDFDPRNLSPQDQIIWRIRGDWDRSAFREDLQIFLASDLALDVPGLVIGCWSTEMYDDDSSFVVSGLCEKADRLAKLKGLYLGDIVSEEAEISWIKQSDITPLFGAFPKLEYLRVRGGDGLRLAEVTSSIRALAIEAGGLSAELVQAVASADLPRLEHLELWLGTTDYGGTSTVEDLTPVLEGCFPNLSYLGLRNCDYADDLARAVAESAILNEIKVLDLSLGTLTDEGGRALLAALPGSHLERLDLHYNYMSHGVRQEFSALSIQVDVSEEQETEDEWRFVAVGE
ncbi:MAG: STM4015 family protein [Thermoanaerobaculia bacterium]|nr:STM4015 family protein [Thermoanaerobaculia bacterium]